MEIADYPMRMVSPFLPVVTARCANVPGNAINLNLPVVRFSVIGKGNAPAASNAAPAGFYGQVAKGGAIVRRWRMAQNWAIGG